MTKMEQWYLRALRFWSETMKRSPSITELAEYCKRSRTPVYISLLSLADKGYLRRTKHRKFEVIP